MTRLKRSLLVANTVKHWLEANYPSAARGTFPAVEPLEERRLFTAVTWGSDMVSTAMASSAQTVGDPLQVASASLVLNTPDIQVNGFGSAWGITRSWTNNEGLQMTNSKVGIGWDINQNPEMTFPNNDERLIEIINSGSSADWFQWASGDTTVFTPLFGSHDQLTYSSDSDLYTLTDATGDQTVLFGASFGNYAYTLDSYTPASGAEISVTAHNSSTGQITQEERGTSDPFYGETIDYTYIASGANAGELQKAVLSRSSYIGGTGTGTIRQVVYSYYGDGTGDTSYGETNDLRTATVEDGSGNVISTDYYRYTDPGDGNPWLLQATFEGAAFGRLQASSGTSVFSNSVSNSDVDSFANLQLSYGSSEPLFSGYPTSTADSSSFYSGSYFPISSEYVAGDGTSTDGTTGIGEWTFSEPIMLNDFYSDLNSNSISIAPDGSGTSSQYNVGAFQTIVTTPSGLTETYDVNYAGETTAEESTASSGSPRYLAYSYDANANVTKEVDALAINTINMSEGTLVPLHTALYSGEITVFNYYSGTSSASSTSAGSASGYLESETVQNGLDGNAQLQESIDYKSQTVGSTTIYYIADHSVYQGTYGTDTETTNYQYNFASGTFSPIALITTLPPVSVSENGTNVSGVDSQVFDANGNVIWEKDPDGNITYKTYDPFTSAVTQVINDVSLNDYTAYNASDGGSVPFTIPSSDGLAVVTTFVTDDQGRVTQESTPNGNVTLTFYNDSNHSMSVYPGWSEISGTSNYATTGPVTVTDENWGGSYDETYTYAYTPSTSTTPNDVGSTPGSLLTLNRTLLNESGQTVERDSYFNVSSSGFSYSASTVQLGTAGTNFYPTLYLYDSDGNLSQTNAPTGTVTSTTFDQFDEPISTSIGTVSAGSTVVSKAIYDVDGRLQESADYPGGSANGRATLYTYTFQGYLASKTTGEIESSGVIGSPSIDTVSNDTFNTGYAVDNLGEVTETDTYYKNSSGSVLTAVTKNSFDSLGRVFSSTVVSVDPSTHLEGTSDTTNYFYDADGNLIAKLTPSGGATKYVYNGAGWNTFIYTTDGGSINNAANASIGSSTAYNAANGVAGDVVVNQVQNVYDNDGNIIETINSDRFGTDSSVNNTPTGYVATGSLGDRSGSGGPAARVSYVLNYYDAADRLTNTANFGTYGGAAFSPSSFTSVPTRGPTVLVNTTSYNSAGWIGSTTDPNGEVTDYAYDALGRTVQTIADYTNGTPTDNSNQTTDYTYDGDNHVTSMTAVVPGSYNQTTGYIYGVTSGINDNDLLYMIEYPSPSTGLPSSSSQDEIYGYDALGEVTSYEDRNGTTHAYTYDQQGRLTSDSVSTGSGVDSTVTELAYGYTNAGQLTTLTSYNSSGGSVNQVVDTYDGFGQLASDAQSHAGNVSGGTPAVSYNYSAGSDDRLTGITYPDGRGIAYNYSGGSGLDSALDRVSLVANASGGTLQSYSYLGVDTPVTFTDGNGVELSYLGTVGGTSGDAGDQYTGLDRFGRVINQNWSTTSQGVDQFSYGYDQDSNVTYKDVTTATSNTSTNTTLAALSQVYTYDGLNRLTNQSVGAITSITGSTATISSPASSEGWVLDAVGNWNSSSSTVSGTTTTTARTNNAQNQVVTSGTATLAYDSNGNTTTDQSGQNYVYDAWNRLVKVSGVNGTTLAQYSYDAQGRQITETHGSTTTDLYYSNRWQVVQENVGSLVTAEHVWTPFYVDAMIQTVTNPQVSANMSNGTVDTGFGTNTSNHTTTTTLSSTPTVAVSATDGSDIVVGIVAGSTPELLFYNASGGLDTTYGSGGIVSLSTVNATSITGMIVQPNGKIDLAIQNASGGMTVVQLGSTGSLDTGFNASGIETLSSLPSANGLIMAGNGNLLVAGVSGNNVISVELNPTDGSLITGYNSSGASSVSMGSDWSSLTFLSMAEAPDGDLVVAGDASYSTGGALSHNAALIAVKADGSSDTAFGTSGVVNAGALTLAPGYSAVAINPAGQIYFGVATGSTSVTLKAMEFNADGSVDNAFGTGGTASTGTISGDGSGLILQIQLNGEIVIGAGGSGSSGHFIVARFTPNGKLDTSFNTTGIKTGVAEGGGLSMVMAANGETIIIGKTATGNGIILEEFGTLATPQTYYVEYDADYNTTSLTNSSGGVVERYTYDPYGNVKVLTTAGVMNGEGQATNSYYGFVYLHQGLRLNVTTGLYVDRYRQTYDSSLGRFLQQDPTAGSYVAGTDLYQIEKSNPFSSLDPSGLVGIRGFFDTIGEFFTNAGKTVVGWFQNNSIPNPNGNGIIVNPNGPLPIQISVGQTLPNDPNGVQKK